MLEKTEDRNQGPISRTAGAGFSRKGIILVAFFSVFVGAMWTGRHALVWMVDLWRLYDPQLAGLAVVACAAWVVVTRRSGVSARPPTLATIALTGFAPLLLLAYRLNLRLPAALFMIATFVVACAWAFRRPGAGALVALFLLFLLSLPEPHMLLGMRFRTMGTALASMALHCLGYHVHHSGVELFVAGKSFLTDAACAGTRAFAVTGGIGAALAIFLGLQGWRALLLCALALVIGFLVNGFRIAAIVWLDLHGYAVDPSTGLHSVPAFVLEALLGTILFGVALFLRKRSSESVSDAEDEPPSETELPRSRTWHLALVAGTWIACAVASSLVAPVSSSPLPLPSVAQCVAEETDFHVRNLPIPKTQRPSGWSVEYQEILANGLYVWDIVATGTRFGRLAYMFERSHEVEGWRTVKKKAVIVEGSAEKPLRIHATELLIERDGFYRTALMWFSADGRTYPTVRSMVIDVCLHAVWSGRMAAWFAHRVWWPSGKKMQIPPEVTEILACMQKAETRALEQEH